MKTGTAALILFLFMVATTNIFATVSSVFHGGHGGGGGHCGAHGGGGHFCGAHSGGHGGNAVISHGSGYSPYSGGCYVDVESNGVCGRYYFLLNIPEQFGRVILYPGDTLAGMITLGVEHGSDKGLWFRDVSSYDGQFIMYCDIQRVRLYDGYNDLFNTDFTDFVPLFDRNNIYRVLYDGSFTIYDDALYTGPQKNILGEDIFYREQGTSIVIDRLYWDNKGLLKNFINKHYGLKMRRRNFDSALSALKFIIDKG